MWGRPVSSILVGIRKGIEMSVQVGPCSWPIAAPDPDDSACLPCPALESLGEEQRRDVEDMARALLWAWTGRRYGLCETAVRPCRSTCQDRPATFWGPTAASTLPRVGGWYPALIGGQWFNIGCGVCSGSCSCRDDAATALELPGPVESIDAIWIGGELLPETAYRLADGILYRVDGEAWPACNTQTEDPREPGSAAWEITYQKGYPVPAGGSLAAYRLVCELAKSICGDNDCALPSRVTSVTRQGVSVAILDGFEGLDEGKTGIWEIDAWIASVAYKVTSPPRVYSPDLPAERGTARSIGFGRRMR